MMQATEKLLTHVRCSKFQSTDAADLTVSKQSYEKLDIQCGKTFFPSLFFFLFNFFPQKKYQSFH